MRSTMKLSVISLVFLFANAAQAQTAADAQGMLKKLVAHAKAKGAEKASADLNEGTDPTKCKEVPGIGCFIATGGAKMLGNAKNQKMVGQEFPPDFTDVDGTPIVSQVIGPFKAGKTTWEAKYKFAIAQSKKIVPQHAFCEKVDAGHLACVTLQNAQ